MGGPDCYACRWRQNVPGSAHSACGNPLVQKPDTAALCAAAVMQFGGFTTDHLAVRFNAHGVRSGWAFFPFNFDPVWLETCTGFVASEAPPADQAPSALAGMEGRS